MALFTDGRISTIEQLLAYESSILDVARIEGINLTAKLELAAEEVGVELTAFLAREAPDVTLSQVVVTEALHKWHTFQTLSLVFRDAYNRQLNDRYEGKRKEYERLARWAEDALFGGGIGLTSDPIPRAAVPELSSVQSPVTPGATYYISVAWVRGNQEGAPSDVTVAVQTDGTMPAVEAVIAPSNATGWNIYAGYTPNDLTLQNDIPLAPGEVWTAAATGLRRGAMITSGQQAETTVGICRRVERG